jgi:hypothetical protein
MKMFLKIAVVALFAAAGCSKSGTQVCEKMCSQLSGCTHNDVEQCQMQYNCVELDLVQQQCQDDQINPYIDCLDNCSQSSCDSVQACVSGCNAPPCVH